MNKHLERVFEKPGIETRTAAANLAQSGMRGACASPVLVAGRPAPPAGSRGGRGEGGEKAGRPAARTLAIRLGLAPGQPGSGSGGRVLLVRPALL